jgi:hypothetical protein
VSDTTAGETPSEESAGAAGAVQTEAAGAPDIATSVWVWIVYALGGLAALAFAASLALVVVAAATGGGGVDISVPWLVVWLLFALAAIVTFVRRRFGGRP